MELAQHSINGNGSYEKRTSRPRYTPKEKRAIRRMLGAGASASEIADWLRSNGRTGATAGAVYQFKANHVRRVRRPATSAQPTEREAKVTIEVDKMEPVSFRASKKTVRAVLELLVGV